MKTTQTGPAGSSAGAGAAPAARRAGRAGDLVAVAGLVAVALVVEFFLRHLLSRPFYYDEASRAYEISEGGRFLAHLGTSAAPLSLGWVGIETAARVLLGDTEAGLRAPMFAVLPVLGVATYLLARRWLGRPLSFCTAALLLVNLWIVNFGLQFKSYSYEALIVVATVALYLVIQRASWGRAQLLGLYAALGLTCVFSLPNLFVLVPLLALDLVRALRGRSALRVAGEAMAAAIALAHYVFFVHPQAGVASTGFFVPDFAPHGLTAFVRFTFDALGSYASTLITGVVGATNAPPSYALPPAFHALLTAGVVVLVAGGVVAAAREAAGRALITAVAGPLLLELAASVVRQWPFVLIRVNIFVLPLLYILGGIGAAWIARTLAGPARSAIGQIASWRIIAITAALALFGGVAVAGGVATEKGFTESSALQYQPSIFDGVKAAVADARRSAAPDDLVIIRADRSPAAWYAAPWLYYMNAYQGWPSQVAALPRIPGRNTISVVYVTSRAVDKFLAAHRGSRAVYLLEFNFPGYLFPQWAHQESLTALRKFGYCPVSNTGYPLTGHLTVLRAGCSAR